MSTVTSRPRPRSMWVDPRFLAGIVIVAVSIVGVWLVVAAARQTTPVLVAARTLVPGETIASGDLRVAEVALGQVGDAYAAPGGIAEGSIALRTVEAGELVPVEALGTADAAAQTTVVVPSSTQVPAAVTVGTSVEVWAAPRTADGGYETPRILVPEATVAHVAEDETLVSSGGAAVELVVPRADLVDLLAALSGEAMLSVVPIGGAGS